MKSQKIQFKLNCQKCSREYFVAKYRTNKSKYCSKICQCSVNGIKGGRNGRGISRNKGAKHPHLSEYNRNNIRYGKDNPNWKGLSSEEKRERNRSGIYLWRKAVLKRDKYTCFLCEQIGGKLEVHHIIRFIDCKELRNEVSNGITLCKICHNFTKGKEIKFIEQFSRYTKKAVEAFQKANGLLADGICGQNTINKLKDKYK